MSKMFGKRKTTSAVFLKNTNVTKWNENRCVFVKHKKNKNEERKQVSQQAQT